MSEKQGQGSGIFLRCLIQCLPSLGSLVVPGRWRQAEQKIRAILGYRRVEANLGYTRPCLIKHTHTRWGGGGDIRTTSVLVVAF